MTRFAKPGHSFWSASSDNHVTS